MEICILDVYLAGFILYTIAMLPFPFYNLLTITFLTVSCSILTIFIHYKSLINFLQLDKIKFSLETNKTRLFDYTIIFLMFLFILLTNLVALSDFVFGSVCDESLHSLMVTAILDNNHVPVALQPYVPEGVTYPQASHVIFAFAFHVLHMDVPKIVFFVSILFKALSVVGAYFLGKKLGSSRVYGLGLSFVFTFISSWPLFIVWGGNPFLFGFPLFLMCLGMLFSLLHFEGENSFAELIALGLLFGYMGAIIISFLQTLIAVALLVLFYYFIRRNGKFISILRKFFIVFSVSLLPISPFIYRFFAFYTYPGHNIGIPSDFGGWASQQLYLTQALQWAFENLSPNVLIRIFMILILIGLLALIWKTKDYENEKPVIAFALAIFVAASLLSFVAFFLSAEFSVISWGHQGIILSIPINILILVFYFKLARLSQKFKFKWLPRIHFKNSFISIPLIIMLLLVTTPFLYNRLFCDPAALRGAGNMFATTVQNDYDLMLWMRENLTSDSVILVHPYDPGLFIPSISHHKIVFPFSGSRFSRSYQALVSLLENNTLRTEEYNVFQLMRNFNITHIFVGTYVVYWMFNPPRWNSTLFLGNPNFKLVKNFNETYLFKFEEYDPNVVFLDDFEYEMWDQNKWRNDSLGNGLGNVTIVTGFGSGGSKCLMITAQTMPTVRGWECKYVYWVNREIFALNNSEVMLSFYLDAREGFGGKDTFALLISDSNSPRSIVITTPSGLYNEFANAITLDSNYGMFSFNLSKEWQRIFDLPPPCSFTLQFVNYDFDGIKNVVYIDDVKVSSTPLW
jgi:hypothetical protein